ncbi:MAG: xanthine dehydrogenase family protein molybdopterin-binding subunit [Anaerolineales bacterium]|uniref:Xanthine dehydrogenase family protein molybdopterin-binding subunit n=1 Tax=Candidatus Desulfolinea nitratireducens TaxID=2841698 RepID=A0A8J6NG21_9CHLR|nr:xanthine dehydrogenase family protein molybdopterin-binding subunit [Candidatus Desulfolinea nitratireducens]MBL6960433.1 xanthine dehydrogenase family protein molybdopterin-binding subunit [Anaerolineales bacterium]
MHVRDWGDLGSRVRLRLRPVGFKLLISELIHLLVVSRTDLLSALVEVDLETGEVKAKRIISGADVGRAINPRSVQGQIEGGIMMGLGNCLTEEYITEKCVPWSVMFARYKIPSIKHLPEIISHIVEDPVSFGPYGAKGVGDWPQLARHLQFAMRFIMQQAYVYTAPL